MGVIREFDGRSASARPRKSSRKSLLATVRDELGLAPGFGIWTAALAVQMGTRMGKRSR
jgi:hypothetical protein